MEWIKVEDKLPEDVGIYAVKIDDGSENISFYVRNMKQEKVWTPWGEYVTHWKPKPTS